MKRMGLLGFSISSFHKYFSAKLVYLELKQAIVPVSYGL